MTLGTVMSQCNLRVADNKMQAKRIDFLRSTVMKKLNINSDNEKLQMKIVSNFT